MSLRDDASGRGIGEDGLAANRVDVKGRDMAFQRGLCGKSQNLPERLYAKDVDEERTLSSVHFTPLASADSACLDETVPRRNRSHTNQETLVIKIIQYARQISETPTEKEGWDKPMEKQRLSAGRV